MPRCEFHGHVRDGGGCALVSAATLWYNHRNRCVSSGRCQHEDAGGLREGTVRASMNDAILAWRELIDRARPLPAAQPGIRLLVEGAHRILGLELVQRVYRLEDVGFKGRTWRDPRVDSPMTDPEVREYAALAHSDCGTCGTAARELETLACAYRITGEACFSDRIVRQLAELATWSPLQRPGWNYAKPGPDGKGGAWLATGEGVHAVVHTLDLLPAGAVPPGVRADLARLLEKEIEEIADDWAAKRTWFIRTNNAITNQWIAPTAALVQACLFLGPERYPDVYRLGVSNLRQSVESHSGEGSFEEGFGYAHYVRHLFYATHAMAVHGDQELYDHPFFRNFGTWYVHHYQPGGFYINCFDAGHAAREMPPAADDLGWLAIRQRSGKAPSDSRADLLALTAVCTGNQDALWALRRLHGAFPATLNGLAASALPPPAAAYQPALYAAYDRARRVNWRSSWRPDASGIWVRGGHPLDQHDHNDRGHVNFVARGRPILIEAGTPSYANLKLPSHYASGAGHNVLQVGLAEVAVGDQAARMSPPHGWQKPRTEAPLTVRRLDADGGEVEVDGTKGYDGVHRWHRVVRWTAGDVQVLDDVELTAGETQVVVFRWHLGTSEPVQVTADSDGRIVAVWADATIRVAADRPLRAVAVPMPDHTLRLRLPQPGQEDVDDLHTCLVIQTEKPVSAVRIETSIAVRRD